VRFVPLERITDELSVDPLNPHLLVMSTTAEGNHMARQITTAMTRFVNENVARAIKRKAVRSLPSVRRWQAKQRSGRRAQKLA
jgi:protein involved in ribonucleotide reduction